MATTGSGESGLERYFEIRERGSTVRTEVLGGFVTFLTMAYIVFVNPAILAAAGMPFDAVTVATALAAAIFTVIMGLPTNLPFALASGLGLNAVVAFDLILGRDSPWQVAMACVVIEGLIAVVLVLAGLREAIMRASRTRSSSRSASASACSSRSSGSATRASRSTTRRPGSGSASSPAGPPLVALAGLLMMIVLTARETSRARSWSGSSSRPCSA